MPFGGWDMAAETPDAWCPYRVGDIADVFDGPHATPKTVEHGPVFLGIQALKDGRLDLRDTRHVTEEDFARWTKRIEPRPDDLVFSYETRLGEAALIPPGLRCCLGRRMGLLRLKPGVPVIPRMLLLAYLGPQFQAVLRLNAVHGSTVDRLPIIRFPDFQISLPGLREQRAIVSVIGALDDMIESNQRLAWTLRQTVLVDHSRLARHGHRVEHLRDLVAVLARGRAPSYVEDGAVVLNQKCVRDGEIDFARSRLTDANKLRRDARLIRIGDVLVNSTGVGTLGRTALVEWLPAGDVCADSHLTIVRADPRSVLPTWLSSDLLQREEEIVGLAEGTTGQTELSRDMLGSLVVRVGDAESQQRHDVLARAVALRRAALARETRVLMEIRSALLPRLVSGQIRVPLSDDPEETLVGAMGACEAGAVA